MTAVPLPGVSRFTGQEVGRSLILHPLREPQQNSGFIILGVTSRTGGQREDRPWLGLQQEHPSLKTNPSRTEGNLRVKLHLNPVTPEQQDPAEPGPGPAVCRELSYEARQFSSAAQRRLYMGVLCT